MRIAQEKVEAFHEKIGEYVAERPEVGDVEAGNRRYEFMREELAEYRTALDRGDLVGIADALADLQYVLLGTALHHGIQLEPVFNEVHRSNMTKTPNPGSFKNALKGPTYEPPRLTEILFIQATKLEAPV